LGDKKLANAVVAYTVARESSFIITDELAGVVGKAAKGEQTDAGKFQEHLDFHHLLAECACNCKPVELIL